MPQYHIFKVQGKYVVRNTTGCNTAKEVDDKLGLPKRTNWYGCIAENEEEALQIAIAYYKDNDYTAL